MFCSKCGNEIPAGSSLCSKCGKVLSDSSVEKVEYITCPECRGRGQWQEVCPFCGGAGWIECLCAQYYPEGIECGTCGGTRRNPCPSYDLNTCNVCEGTGKLTESELAIYRETKAKAEEERIRKEEEKKRREAEEAIKREEERKRKEREKKLREIEEQKRRDEEVKRLAAADAEQRRRTAIQENRHKTGKCIMCGKDIGLWDKISGRTQHTSCQVYKDI